MVESDADFQALTRTIQKILGFQCGSYKEDYIKRRVLSRMRITGKSDFKDYNAYLLSNTDEQEHLRNALTVNVTKFYRDKEVFDVVKNEIIPSIIAEKGRMRIWSAGCSTGEEPYTLALIISDALRLRTDVPVTIFASDIDREVLKKAREGIYDKRSLENLTETQISRHFNHLENGKYQVKDHLKSMIRFSQHDLLGGRAVTNFLDMVLCRNVTIYFTEKQKDDLARMFHPALVPDGYYIMGKTEFMGREVEDLYTPYNALQKIYRKKQQ
ncbi:MAG: protein-glutamate O-methyltransferase CheR [Methanomicrobium sp.]|jgi:chemotaxis protein methyltransferase CheR|uniref:CheR family methyltransferase n=1 Tax=Methanomicrobium mobile TaxID=2205 RepID=UPI0005B2E360|nr:protein-glutamate O-methyltransferase CheR [Methanomicrobium mobile]MBP5083574.1 protein-glutamate O-methyltransferase CheR [Methanomicrobium sp.]MBP5475578.1 protein-glutamate O-methyltransferase CheR [Methanomicrobium sp.]